MTKSLESEFERFAQATLRGLGSQDIEHARRMFMAGALAGVALITEAISTAPNANAAATKLTELQREIAGFRDAVAADLAKQRGPIT